MFANTDRHCPKGESNMEQKHVDPVYEYVDEKIKLIKRDLQRLKEAHDAVAAEQKKALLETQRFIAKFNMIYVQNTSLDLLEEQQPEKGKNFISKFIVECTLAISKLDTSDNPFFIATEFSKERYDELEKLGIRAVRISS